MVKQIEDGKKKLIRVGCKTDNTNSHNYEYTSMAFTFVSSPENGRMQCYKPMTCRESVNKAVSNNMAAGKTDIKEQIDFEKLRLLIVKNIKEDYDTFKERLFSGKALLNRYEEKAGWEPSRITTVKHEFYKNAWLLTGPKEWMSQPQLLAIATMFIRVMSVHGPLKVDTFQEAEDSLKELYSGYMRTKNNIKEGDYFEYYSDIENYLKYMDNIRILITNAEEMFSNITLEKAWEDNSAGGSFSIQSGLLSFFNGTTLTYNDSATIAQNRFAKLSRN